MFWVRDKARHPRHPHGEVLPIDLLREIDGNRPIEEVTAQMAGLFGAGPEGD